MNKYEITKELTEAFKVKYPELSVLSRECDNCGKTITANIPYITKGYVGLTAKRCECGKNRFSCRSMLTNSEEENRQWREIL